MPTIKLSLSDEQYNKLQEVAKKEKMSIQDYIRDRLLPQTSIFTPDEAIKRVLDKLANKEYEIGTCFTLPELYGEEWTIERGVAGVFGKRFFNYIEDGGCDKIEFAGMTNYGRHANYRIK